MAVAVPLGPKEEGTGGPVLSSSMEYLIVASESSKVSLNCIRLLALHISCTLFDIKMPHPLLPGCSFASVQLIKDLFE